MSSPWSISRRTTAILIVVAVVCILLFVRDPRMLAAPRSAQNVQVCTLAIPAVALPDNGPAKGVMVQLSATLVAGSGRVVVAGDDAQALEETFQRALDAARSHLDVELGGHDVHIRVGGEHLVVGRSGEAALVLLIACAAQNGTLEQGTTITASVNPDGTLGGVDHLFEKARAVREAGLLRLWVASEDAVVLSWVEERDPGTGQLFISPQRLPVEDAFPGLEGRTAVSIKELAAVMLVPTKGSADQGPRDSRS